MNDSHLRLDEIHDLVDGRLNAQDRRRVESHLEECSSCRAARDRIVNVRQVLRSAWREEEVPDSIRARVSQAIDRESRRPHRSRWVPIAAAAAAAAAIVAIVLIAPDRSDLPAAAVADLNAVASGELRVQMRSADPEELGKWLDRDLGFHTRVLDFDMMRYRLVGGRVDELEGRKAALLAYRHDNGAFVICQMYQGSMAADLPEGGERIERSGIEFFVFERDGATTVFWQEGPIVCVLTSRIPRDEVVALAEAKAKA